MKKILILTAVLVLTASSCFAAAATSAATSNIDFETTGTGKTMRGDRTTATATTAQIGKCSTGVAVAWSTSTAGYALMTQHKSGTKAYGSSYDSTAIYQWKANAAPGTAAYNSGALTATDTTDFTDAKGFAPM
jgi:hypothetical protein